MGIFKESLRKTHSATPSDFMDSDNSPPPPAAFSKKESLKLPFASDKKKWITLNNKLAPLLNVKFPIPERNSFPLAEFAKEVPQFIYNTLLEICGVKMKKKERNFSRTYYKLRPKQRSILSAIKKAKK